MPDDIKTDKFDAVETFTTYVSGVGPDSAVSPSIAAVKTLRDQMNRSNAVTTFQELANLFPETVDAICQECDQSNASVRSATELFQRFITLGLADVEPDKSRDYLLERADSFLKKMVSRRRLIAQNAACRIPHGSRIMLLSYSRVVLEALVYAHNVEDRYFECLIVRASSATDADDSGGDPNKTSSSNNSDVASSSSTSSPSPNSEMMAAEIEARCGAGAIPCQIIAATAIAQRMEDVDLVLFGAESVLKSGGVLNRLGTLSMALIARHFQRPIYVLAESFKLHNLFPVRQRDIPIEMRYSPGQLKRWLAEENLDCSSKAGGDALKRLTNKYSCRVDYTGPQLINLIITDLGPLTPAAISDEVKKLYL